MSQHDMNIENQGFPAFRSDLNNALAALASTSAGATEPSTTFANQLWYDSTANLLKMRNTDNDAWITLAYFDQTNDEWEVRSAVIQAVDSAGVVIKTDDGTTRVEIADDGSVTVNTSLDVDNIKIDGNSITSTDTNGNINITPNGTGKVVLDGLSYPTADGTDGQVLTTDGSGNIAFEDAGGAGKILQVVNTSKEDVFSTISTSFVDVTGLSLSITPSSASNDILIIVNLAYSNAGGSVNDEMRILEDGSNIHAVNNLIRLQRTAEINYASFTKRLSPSTTSALTYKVQVVCESASFRLFINQRGAGTFQSVSSITAMEIAG